jgi:hypothetical protein
MGSRPVTIVSAGAPAFVNVADLSKGAPTATPVDAGGAPIVLVSAGAPPICLINDDGTVWEAP